MILQNLHLQFWKFLKKTDRQLASICCWLILHIRPLLGPGDICPFVIGCTNFAIIALETRPVPVATAIIIKRLLMCNPVWLWWNLCKKTLPYFRK